MDRDNGAAALELAALGFRVLPLHTVNGERCDCNRDGCPSPAKHPRVTDWPNAATADEGTVGQWFKQWPHANVGIATGAASDLVVIDVDPRNGGYEELLRLYKEHGNPPAGPVVYTGGGGWHLYFKHPGGKVMSRSIAPGIDCKGDGGQVVAPPSYHASGNQYEWCETGLDYEKPVLPDWMLLMVKSDSDEGPSSYARPVVGTITTGKRRETLLSLAGTMRRRGFGQEGIFRALMAENEERCDPPLDRTEVASIAASAAKSWEPQEGIIISSGKAAEGVLGTHGQKRSVEPRTMTFAELQGEDLPPLKMAVPDLLPVGLALLAGRLKLGKSWCMLGCGIAIAEGGIAFGEFPVEGGDVLYVAYEDTRRRFKNRGKVLLGETAVWPDRLHIAFSGDWPTRDDGGLEAVDTWLGAHPQARLVIIDTLQRFRGGNAGEGDKNAYAADYGVSAELQELAMKHEVVIVAIHHYRKSLSETDWVDQISGTNGIAGAADVILGFERKRGEQTAILRVTGRDIEKEGDYAMVFDTARYGWIVAGTAEDLEVSREAFEFTKALWDAGRGEPVHYRKVAEELGKKHNTTHKMGQRLADKGEVVALGSGMYKPVHRVQTVENRFKSYGQVPVQTPVHAVHEHNDEEGDLDSRGQALDRGLSTDFESENGHLDSVDSNLKNALSTLGQPTESCPTCGEHRWTVRVGGRWLCGTCSPAVTQVGAGG